jgi:hypothetical protein
MRALILSAVLGLACVMSGTAAAADSPALATVTLRLYEQADAEILPVARRLYSTVFDATRTRTFGVEIAASHAAPESAAGIPVDCTMQKPDGNLLPRDRPLILELAAGTTYSSGAGLPWRAPDAEGWQPGEYAIECRIAGQVVAESRIKVVQNEPDVAGTDIRVAAIRLFPVERTLPARDERRYASTLVAAEMNHIGVELEFTHAPLGQAMRIPVECYYFWPDGQTSPAVMLTYEPQATWSGGYSAGALGWDQPGYWLPGVYTVTCMIGGRPVIVDRFDLM